MKLCGFEKANFFASFPFPFYEIWNSHHHNVLELAFNVATIKFTATNSKPSLDI